MANQQENIQTIGIPKEIKIHERRIGAPPAMVQALVKSGKKVFVQKNAATDIGFTNDMYSQAGATIVESAAEVYQSDMIIKVKEPQESEYPLLRKDQVLFCYLHLAPDPVQTQNLLKSEIVGIAYETVTDKMGRLPLLEPMSAIAGRIAIQTGANYLQLNNGGKGVLLGGVPGVLPANVLIIGGGVVGLEAARMAMGLGANVTILDRNLNRIRQIDELYAPRLKTLYSSQAAIEELLPTTDLLIGAVLIPGKSAPKLISRKMIAMMQPGSVFVDVSIDQGGCAETSKPTSHSDPVYVVDGVIHYCVTNMPGACAQTATRALTNATMDYALKIANEGFEQAMWDDEGLRKGLNVCKGYVTNLCVAESLQHQMELKYIAPETILTK